MKLFIRSFSLAVALATGLATLAEAGGAGVSLERAKDGKYIVHSFACTGPSSVSLVATAEGVVNGERKSIPLTLEPMKSPGTYRFERTWPAQGTWLVRTEMLGSRHLVGIATLARDGRVTGTELLAEGDGRHECDQKLAANTK